MRKTEEYSISFSDPMDEKPKQSVQGTQSAKQRFTIFDAAQAVLAALVLVALLFTFLFRVVRVIGPSMKPTLEDGNRVLVSAVGYSPKAGDIVVLSQAHELTKPIVKRIVAVGGDVVDINFTTGVVTVNDKEEHYTYELTNQQFDIAFPITVPEGTVFVLGDNRPDSLDSRSTMVGCVDERYIVGKVMCRIFPLGHWTVK